MKKYAVIAILLVVIGAFAVFSLSSPRDCLNCGARCCQGSCDQSSACAQCYIYDCMMGGGPQTLDCGICPQ